MLKTNRNAAFVFFIFFLIIFASCGKSELELQKEKLKKEAAELKAKIDSTQVVVDSSKTELDSLMMKAKKESRTIDSLEKVIESIKK